MDIANILKEAKYYKKLNGLSRAVKKFLLSSTFLSKIVNTSIYNVMYNRKIRKKAKNQKPKILQIENTNLCNAKCIMCPHSIMKRKGKVMALEKFKRVLDNVLESYRIEKLTITGFGEPFVDKDLIKKIKYVNKKYPKLKTEIYTNASLLTKGMTDKLLKTKFEKVTFSVNGTKRIYKKIMGLDYDNTKRNILYFLQQKKKLKHPVLTNISLMILKENEKDIRNFIMFWRPFAESVRVYAPSDWSGTLKNLEMIQKIPFKEKRWPCFALWNNLTIDVDGNVIMCCRDYESRVKFGNVLKKDIKEIRNSKKFQELLKKQLNFDFKTAVCKSCNNSFDSSLDWIC
jgi:radical SAM protein with 4Fe4S-binding SPASM domain